MKTRGGWNRENSKGKERRKDRKEARVRKEEEERGSATEETEQKKRSCKYVRVGTAPIHDLMVFWGSSGSKLEHSSPLSLHTVVTRRSITCMPAHANPKYPITD